MFFHAKSRRRIAPLLLALALSLTSTARVQEPSVLVREGDAVQGSEVVSSLGNFSVTDSARTLVETGTDLGGAGFSNVIIEDGAVILRIGDALPNGAGYSTTYDLHANNTGNVVGTFVISGFPSGQELGVYYDDVLVAQWGAAVNSAQVPPGTVYGPLLGARVNDVNEVLAVMFLDDDPTFPGFSLGTALVRFQPDDPANPTSFTPDFLMYKGVPVPGLDIPATGVTISAGSFGLNNHGSILYTIHAQAALTANSAIVLDGTLIAREGRLSPLAGRRYLGFFESELDLNDFGDVVFKAMVDGDSGTNEVILRNDEVFLQEGDALASITPYRIQRIQPFDAAPIEISNAGDVYWFGEFDDPNFATNTAFFRNHEVILRKGDMLGSDVVTGLRSADYAFDVSDSGRFFLAGVTLQGTVDALVLADFGSVVPVLGCGTNTAELALADGLALTGDTLHLELDGAQAVGAMSILYLSAGPALLSPCGPMGGFGELLINLGTGSRIARIVGGSFTGAGVPLDVAIPADPALVDMTAYAQGLFVSPGGAEPLRATNGLRIEIGAP